MKYAGNSDSFRHLLVVPGGRRVDNRHRVIQETDQYVVTRSNGIFRVEDRRNLVRELEEAKREGIVPAGARLTTANEEYHLLKELADKRRDPCYEEGFAELFDSRGYDPIRTVTSLRVPNGWGGGRYERTASGALVYPRFAMVNGVESGEVKVAADGVVREVDEVFGIPTVTEKPDGLARSDLVGQLYFQFDPSTASGCNVDVNVTGLDLPRSGRHIAIEATHRMNEDCGMRFHLVDGRLPKIKAYNEGGQEVPGPYGGV